ncbi:MAG: hypothetical protein KAS12_06715, partial [Candidatus Aenigmarchaeota archaeon]|nr:hypothetical protein [Candidatus Aenigmarchaeota archaeon]
MEQNTQNQNQPAPQASTPQPQSQQSQPPKKKSNTLKTILIVLIVIIVIIAIIGTIIYFLVAKFLRRTLGIENMGQQSVIETIIDKGKDLIGEKATDKVDDADNDNGSAVQSTGKMNDDIMVEITARQMYYMYLVGEQPDRASAIQKEMDDLYKKYSVTVDEVEAYGNDL